MVPARCIALVVALVVGAAALPAFALGTWELVNPDANSDWAEAYTQIADGTFTGYGSWTDAGQTVRVTQALVSFAPSRPTRGRPSAPGASPPCFSKTLINWWIVTGSC